jgi:hypothetical protein
MKNWVILSTHFDVVVLSHTSSSRRIFFKEGRIIPFRIAEKSIILKRISVIGFSTLFISSYNFLFQLWIYQLPGAGEGM